MRFYKARDWEDTKTKEPWWSAVAFHAQAWTFCVPLRGAWNRNKCLEYNKI